MQKQWQNNGDSVTKEFIIILFFLLMKKLLIFYLLVALNISAQSATKSYTIYFLININSCSNCNLFSRDLLENKNIFNHTSFLLSEQDVTLAQADNYLHELFDTSCNITINTSLFELFAKQISFFKMPHLIIADNNNKIVFKTPIDSIRFNVKKIENYIPERKEITISNPRLRQLIGYRTIVKVKDKLFITFYQQKEKIYILDLKKNTMDSLYFSNVLLEKLFTMASIEKTDIAALKSYYKTKGIPYHLAEFGISPCTDGRYFYGSVDMMYVDMNKVQDTIKPLWLPYLIKYDPENKSILLYKYQYWQSDPASYTNSTMKQDDKYKQWVNDSTWIIGGDVKSEGFAKSKALLEFRLHNKELMYSSKVSMLTVDGLTNFNGIAMNDEQQEYFYKYTSGFLFFNQSPVIFNSSNHSTVDVRNFDKNIDWIYDISFQQNTIKILTQKEKQFLLLTVDSKNYSLLNKEIIVNTHKGNVELAGESIYYMDMEGTVHVSGY